MSQLTEQEIAAARLEELLNQRVSAEDYRFPRPLLRDFIAMCVFDLGLEVTPELQPAMQDFFAELGLPPEASAAEYEASIRAYLTAHPVDPRLPQELGSLGRDLLLGRGEGYQSTIEEMRALISIGAQLASRAPQEGVARPSPKPRKGLD